MLRDVQTLLDSECAANLGIMVTFTDVRITTDFKYATIFYSVFGDEKAKKKVSSYLAGIRGRVQSQLGRLLSIKHTPEIKFEFDPSIERGIRIQKLLDEISTDSNENEQK